MAQSEVCSTSHSHREGPRSETLKKPGHWQRQGLAEGDTGMEAALKWSVLSSLGEGPQGGGGVGHCPWSCQRCLDNHGQLLPWMQAVRLQAWALPRSPDPSTPFKDLCDILKSLLLGFSLGDSEQDKQQEDNKEDNKDDKNVSS